jgi:hypothetical protein
MTKSETLGNLIEEVYLNGTWVAYTNYKDQLEDLDWKTATTRVAELNTIALLAQHIHYYVKGVINVFENNRLEIRDKYSFDFPPLNSQEQWDDFLITFWKDAQTLANHVRTLNEAELEKPFVEEKYGRYFRNMVGMLEHSYYHLGQIVLIKKLVKAHS